ncbi:hypothetical protein ATK86_7039 [Nocardia fluminea]|uniref:Uncharacterized protein n=1 Tax=Nocardia fluminea TaxID=134984 RepID=A0A2N3VLT4_9NOCA|nr:hypothetical protein ATK86_7039 [Nocardia fluminea]
MTHSDELHPQSTAARQERSSSTSANPSADTLTPIEATHAFSPTRAELVNALEAMRQAGFLATAPTPPTVDATGPHAPTTPAPEESR